jgi:hypothetical protein
MGMNLIQVIDTGILLFQSVEFMMLGQHANEFNKWTRTTPTMAAGDKMIKSFDSQV